MVKTNRIANCEAGYGEGQYCNQTFYRQHISRPPFVRFPYEQGAHKDLGLEGTQYPPERANRLPCMVEHGCFIIIARE